MYTCSATLKGHVGFITSCAYLPPSGDHVNGLYITGGMDHNICVWEPAITDTPLYMLTGHTDNVCCLSCESSGMIVSGSWDKSGRVWQGNEFQYELKSHDAAVWDVLIVSKQLVITASADKTIKLWNRRVCIKTITGHTDCVRSLCLATPQSFLSTSNDMTVRLWTIKGDEIAVYREHMNFVYSIASLGSGNFATCGEDYTCRIWKNGKCVQVIQLPVPSIWKVAVLTNGDIAIGACDGVCRVFSSHADRIAAPDLVSAFHENVKDVRLSAIGDKEIGGVKIQDLPGIESLFEPGNRDGQTRMVRDGVKVVLYNWSAASGEWVKVGDVMGSKDDEAPASGATGKTTHQGIEYDFVFNVDIDDSRPNLKLPYNLDQDPWHSAQEFIHKNDLPQGYLETVAGFITDNTKSRREAAKTPMQTNHTDFVDPYTGGSRYIPGSASGPAIHSGSATATPPAQHMDTSDDDSSSYFPQNSFITFSSAKNLPAILGKLGEYNTAGGLGVSEEEMRDIVALSEGRITEPGLKVLHHKLLSWGPEHQLPCVDLFRLSVLNDSVNSYFFSSHSDHTWDIMSPALQPGDPNNLQMMMLRVLTNLFTCEAGRKFAQDKRDSILDKCTKLVPSKNNIEVCVGSVILNYCIFIHLYGAGGGEEEFDSVAEAMGAVSSCLSVITDREAQYRLVVALGTLVSRDDVTLMAAQSMDLLTPVKNLTQIKDCEKLKIASTLLTQKLAL